MYSLPPPDKNGLRSFCNAPPAMPLNGQIGTDTSINNEREKAAYAAIKRLKNDVYWRYRGKRSF